jgi:uncharacterized membrane protein
MGETVILKKSTPRTPKHTLIDRMRTTVRGYMLRGLLVLVPLGITVYALILCYQLTAAHLAPVVRRLSIPIPEYALPYAVVAISVVLFFAMLYVIGLATAVVVGRQFIGLGEAILRRIPLVKTVYSASKQAIDLIQPKDDSAPGYQEAAIIDFPGVGIRAIAFVVGRTHIEGRGEFCRVFIPTTPNPTSGYVELYPAHLIQQSDLTVEDAFKGVMSAGILVPDMIDTADGAQKSAKPALTAPSAATVDASSGTRKPVTVWQTAKNVFRRRILSGFFVLVPLAITAFVVTLIYDFTAGRIEFATATLLRPIHDKIPEQAAPILTAFVSIVLLLSVLYVTGYIATWVVGGRIIRLGEAVLNHIPLIATVYGASKQIVEMVLFKKGGSGFQQAVVVEYPYAGVYAVGFLVGKSHTTTGETFHRVFVPTAPNISVGLLQLFTDDQVHSAGMTVEETVKMVVSCGLIGPDVMQFNRVDDEANLETVESAP